MVVVVVAAAAEAAVVVVMVAVGEGVKVVEVMVVVEVLVVSSSSSSSSSSLLLLMLLFLSWQHNFHKSTKTGKMDMISSHVLCSFIVMIRTDVLIKTTAHRRMCICCTGHAGVNGNERADRPTGMADITTSLRPGRAEVLRGLRNFLNMDKPEYHSLRLLKVGLLVGWLLKRPSNSVSQGQIYSDNCMRCHTGIEVTD